MLEQRENWEVKDTWFVKGPGEVERGIFFTVNHFDKLMHRQLMLEDVHYREDRYIKRHADWIRNLLWRYKHPHYAPKALESMGKARTVSEVFSQRHYTPFYRVVLLRCLAKIEEEKRMSSYRSGLLNLIVKTFKIDIESLGEMEKDALSPSSITLPEFTKLQCYRLSERDQPKKHAKEATVFEISPKS